ncbi:MAG: 50S ribosomal protein L3 [Candidatus Peregrinibacteria bacterium]
MPSGLIARKVGMSRIFLPDGAAVPVTYLSVEPNTVVRVKTKERDGYDAVVLGIGARDWTSRKGKAHVRYALQKEWKVDSLSGLEAGKKITVEVVPEACTVSIMGISKGKGFAGTIKRHHFSGGPASHGSHFKREPGSIGMRTQPGRIHKGKRMEGHMGTDTVTIKERPVIMTDKEKGVIAVKGPVPGANGSAVFVTIETLPNQKA